MPQSLDTIFLQGTPGPKLPFHVREKFDTPSDALPFYVNKIAIENRPLTNPNLVHIHNGIELSFIISGNAQLYIDGLYYEIQPGDCIFNDAKVPHMSGTVDNGPVRLVYAHVNTSLVLSIPPPALGLELLSFFYVPQKSVTPVIKNQSHLCELLLEASVFFKDKTPFGKMTAWGKIVEALSELAGIISAFSKIPENATSKFLRTTIQTALRFIHAHYNEMITVDQIAHECNKSPSRLSHVFSQVMGCSPIDYRNKVRIDTAMEKILSTDTKIESIALSCGFESLSNFYDIFKKITGNSPSFFRKTA